MSLAHFLVLVALTLSVTHALRLHPSHETLLQLSLNGEDPSQVEYNTLLRAIINGKVSKQDWHNVLTFKTNLETR